MGGMNMFVLKIEKREGTMLVISPKRVRDQIRKLLKEHGGYYVKTKRDEPDTLYFDSVKWS
jgi:hypothetical protein